MRRNILTLILALVTTGCAGVLEQTFNQNRANVRTIAIAPPVYEEELMLRYRNDQLETVDLISPVPVGRLFAYIAKENREAEFTERATTATAALAADLERALHNRLNALEVAVMSAPSPSPTTPRARNHLLKHIPADMFNGADALLETTGEIGFAAAGRGKPYEPALWLNVRLTDRDGATLLQDRIEYNPSERNAPGVILYPSGNYRFDAQEDLLDSAEVATALREATNIVADELAFLLKGPMIRVR